MTKTEAKEIIRKEYLCVERDCDIERSCGKCDLMMPSKEPILEAYKVAIKALEQEPKTGAGQVYSTGDMPEYKVTTTCDDCKYKPKQGEWISVEDRLPADGMDILFASEDETHYGTFHIGMNSGFYDMKTCSEEEPYAGYYKVDEITAWMPLPEPYKAESEDKK